MYFSFYSPAARVAASSVGKKEKQADGVFKLSYTVDMSK